MKSNLKIHWTAESVTLIFATVFKVIYASSDFCYTLARNTHNKQKHACYYGQQKKHCVTQ